jgi:O-antigen/teichoic acid export membrane protein
MIKIGNRGQRLLKDTIIYGFGLVSVKIFNFLFIPVFTRYVNPEEYGYFELINTTISLLIPIISFQISEGIYRYLLDCKDEQLEKKDGYISNSLNIVLKNILIFILLVVILNLLGIDDKIKYFNLISLWLIFAILNGLFMQTIRGLKKTFLYSISNIIMAIVNITLNIAFVIYFNMSIYGMVLANVISFGVTDLFIIIKLNLYKYINKLQNKRIRNDLLKYSAPLILSTMAWWIVNVSDRYVIAGYLSKSELGIYAVAAKFALMLNFMYSIFYMGWQTVAIENYNKKDMIEFYSKIFNLLALCFFSIVIISIIVIKPFMKFYVAEDYFEAYKLIPFLLLAAVFNSFSSFYGIGYLSTQNTKGASITSLIAAIINLLINLLLIKKYGINTAVISTFVAFFAMWVIRIITMKKYFYVKIRFYNILLFIISLYSIIYMFKG